MSDLANTVPVDILGDLHRHVAHRPETTWLVFEDVRITYRTLSERVDRLAGALLGMGLYRGDRVAILALTSPLFFELLFACAKAGLIMVPINHRLSAREVGEVLDDAIPALVITSGELRHLLPADGDWRLVLEDGVSVCLEALPQADLPVPGTPDEPVLILYTSGTTGRPKGVTLTQRNLSFLSRMARELWDFDASSTNLVSTPLFHIGGIGWGLLAFTQGGTTVLTRESAADALVTLMSRYPITHAFMVPTMIQRLVDHMDAVGVVAPGIAHMAYGAAPIGDALLRRALSAFGGGFHHTYGMTETAGTVVTLDPADHDPDGPNPQRLQSCGRAMPWVEMVIVDPGTGRILGPGEVGEVRLRSPAITAGYWRKEAETARAITQDGWLCTGDAGELDEDGYLYIRDRYKDMIVSGAENIYPKEIENMLEFHPAIAEAAVIGVPHEKWGETPWAFVALRPEACVTAEEVIAFTREHLARYKCPSGVSFLPNLPRNASGKVMKHVLREQI
jgi:acyl-CoA synthetase (AMP-forming)/AMP-acid ligase II